MRTLWLALPLFLLGCIDEVTDDDCDIYVDYLCTCGVENCLELEGQFAGADLQTQDQCRIDLACFEEADANNGATCSIVGTPEETQCLAE